MSDDNNVTTNELDTSTATYASKSPERPSQNNQEKAHEMKELLAGKASAYAVLKPKFEQLTVQCPWQ